MLNIPGKWMVFLWMLEKEAQLWVLKYLHFDGQVRSEGFVQRNYNFNGILKILTVTSCNGLIFTCAKGFPSLPPVQPLYFPVFHHPGGYLPVTSLGDENLSQRTMGDIITLTAHLSEVSFISSAPGFYLRPNSLNFAGIYLFLTGLEELHVWLLLLE